MPKGVSASCQNHPYPTLPDVDRYKKRETTPGRSPEGLHDCGERTRNRATAVGCRGQAQPRTDASEKDRERRASCEWISDAQSNPNLRGRQLTCRLRMTTPSVARAVRA